MFSCSRRFLSLTFSFFTLISWTEQLKATHAINLYGETPKYGVDAKNWDHVNPDAPKGGELSLMAPGTFDSFNPFIVKGQPAAGLSIIYPNLVYVSLTQYSYDEAGFEYGYAAESIDVAKDLKSVTFKLRPNITFHDGSPLTSADVVFSFETLIKKGNPLYKNYYGDVIKVTALDARTIRFDFKDDTNRELACILGQFPIFSKAYYTKNSFDQTLLIPPLGNGPYRIKSFKVGQEVVYERVKGWWGENLLVNKGRYNFDRIRYSYFKDGEIGFQAFKAGAYNFRAENVIKNWVKGYTFPAFKEGRVKKIETPQRSSGVMQGLVLNTRRPLFQDVRVRRAFVLAFDFEWLNQKLFYGQYNRCYSYYSGTELAADPLPSAREIEILKPYAGKLPSDIFTKPLVMPKTKGDGRDRINLREADRLLKEAGYMVVNGKRINPQTKAPVVFEILISDSQLIRTLGDYIDNLEHLGIEAKVKLVEPAQYFSRTQDFDFDTTTMALGQSISPGNEQREFWGSKVSKAKGSKNYAGIADPVVDELVEYLIDAPSRQELVMRTKALDRVLMAGSYMVPFYYSGINRLAMWSDLESTGKFPKYAFDLYAFWSKNKDKQTKTP